MNASNNCKYIMEVCVDNAASCHEAVKGKADRIELCASLELGGITPSAAMIRYAKEHIFIPAAVMIRPREGDFLYSDEEFEIMKNDIDYCRQIGVSGVVFGLLTAYGEVDKERTKQLVERAGDMEVCFHRAIDMTQDIFKAMEDIIECGCTRVLTSGGAGKATEGIENIKRLQDEYGERMDIMVGSGISSDNAELFKRIGIRSFHLSGKARTDSRMQYRKTDISMGGDETAKEYTINQTDHRKLLSLRNILG